jgi:hypothetical protein
MDDDLTFCMPYTKKTTVTPSFFYHQKTKDTSSPSFITTTDYKK